MSPSLNQEKKNLLMILKLAGKRYFMDLMEEGVITIEVIGNQDVPGIGVIISLFEVQRLQKEQILLDQMVIHLNVQFVNPLCIGLRMVSTLNLILIQKI